MTNKNVNVIHDENQNEITKLISVIDEYYLGEKFYIYIYIYIINFFWNIK